MIEQPPPLLLVLPRSGSLLLACRAACGLLACSALSGKLFMVLFLVAASTSRLMSGPAERQAIK
jgi:hypothetical protein